MSDIDLKSIHFLHIDDFANYRSMLKSILQHIGVEHIDGARDALSAMELVEQNHYDVILCDYNLGDGQNGQQFLEEAMNRNLLAYGTIFIMVTAENTMDMVMAAIEYRPDAYLNKPFPKELLVSRLSKLMHKKEVFKSIYQAYNQQQYDAAMSLCDQQLKKNPKLAIDIGKLKAEIAIKSENYPLALSLYDKALSIRPFDWAQYGKAQILFAQKDYSQAQEIIEMLLAENKNYVEAYDILAKIHKINKNPKKAQETLEIATHISPRTITRQQSLAQTAIENNDSKVAEKSLRASISLGKHSYLGDIKDYLGLSKLYIDNGKLTKALKIIDKAKSQYKKDPCSFYQANVMESIAQAKLGNEEKARKIFLDTMHNMPNEIHKMPSSLQEDMLNIAELLSEHEVVKSFKDDIDNQGKNSSSSKEKYKYLMLNSEAMRLYENKNLVKAIPLFEEAADKLPEHISINMNAAQALLMQLQKNNKDPEIIKKKLCKYLDVSQSIDPHNKKYLKLAKLYSELK